ncbi:MAG: DUF2244 domain-containing protein [Thiobacillus sp.]
MEQVVTEGVEWNSAGAFVFHSRPRCSLTRWQERLVFWSLVLLCFGAGIGFATLGYWLILPFAGLEVGLLAWALDALRNREADYETITIDGNCVVLEWRTSNRDGRRELNRQWVRVACNCSTPGRNCRLSMSSHGRETEVGHFLSDEARLQLAATLRNELRA